MKATHKKRIVMIGYQKIELEPGQFIFGREKAASETPLSQQNIRTCLEKLKNLGMLTIKPTSKFSIITICNWGVYNVSDYKTNHQTNQEATNSQPSANQPLTTDKNEDNIENDDNKEKNSCSETQEVPHEQEEVFISIPLVDKTEFDVTVNYVKEMSELYPGIDVEQELRNIKGWNLAKPIRRKTRRGIKSHINSWLIKKQDSARGTGIKPKTESKEEAYERAQKEKRQWVIED